MTAAVVSMVKLRKSYRGRNVLEVDALECDRGEVLALTGPNGAGKSTLLRLIALLERADSAKTFSLFGEKTTSLEPQSTRRRMAMVMQEPFLFRGSAFDNIALGLKWRRIDQSQITGRVKESASLVGLVDLERPARELSRGQAQRLALARALALEPELLLLDEPLSAMDIGIRSQLLSDLKPMLTAGGRATILVTHNVEEAERLGTRRMKMVEGRITT